jgi:hypothetical protein
MLLSEGREYAHIFAIRQSQSGYVDIAVKKNRRA